MAIRIRIQVFFASTLNLYLNYVVVNRHSDNNFLLFIARSSLHINCCPLLGHFKLSSDSNVALNFSFPIILLYKCASLLIKWTWILRQYSESLKQEQNKHKHTRDFSLNCLDVSNQGNIFLFSLALFFFFP